MRWRVWPLVAGIAVIGAFWLAFSGRFAARQVEELDPPQATIAFHAPEQLANVVAELIESFHDEFPHIRVQYEPLPDDVDERRERLERAFADAGAARDESSTFAGNVYAVELSSVARWRQQGWAMPLGQFDADGLAEEFVRPAFEQLSFSDDTYGLPWLLEPGLLYYRRDLVEWARLDPPRTWDELVAMSRRMIDQGLVEHGFVWAGAPSESLTMFFLELLRTNGESLVDEGELTLNRPAAREALDFMRDTMQRYGISPNDIPERSDGEARELFVAGDALFLRYQGVLWSTDEEKDIAARRWGVAPFPAGPRGEGAHVALNGQALVIGGDTTAADAAWDFIHWMTSEAAQTRLGVVGDRLPARAAPYQTPDMPETQPFFTTMYVILTNNAFSPPPFPAWGDISDTIRENVYAVLTESLTPGQALERMVADVERLVPPEARRDQRDTRIGIERRPADGD